MVITVQQILTQFLPWPMEVGTIVFPTLYMEKPRNREIKECIHDYTASIPGFRIMEWLQSRCSEPVYHA